MMVLLLVASGCARKGITTSATTEVTDSVHVREVTRLVEVKIPGDTVTLDHYIECDSATNKPKPFKVQSKSKRARIAFSVDKTGKLEGIGICDSLNQVIKAKDTEIFKLRSELKTKATVKIEYRTRGFDKFARWYLIINIVLLIGFIFYRLNKYF